MPEITIRSEGTRVQLIADGQLVLDVPWNAALLIGREMILKGKESEVSDKAAEIVRDQAILIRAGVPIGLTNHPDLLKEAGKEAAWNSDLRRYMPGGVKSTTAVGKPAIRVHPVGENDAR